MVDPSTTAPCRNCGLVPTRVETIRRHVGLVVVQKFISLEQPLCRVHGTQTTRRYLLQTLWQGWWGLISFFVNWFVVVSDLVVLFRYRSLDEPRPVSATGFAQPVQPAAQPAAHPVQAVIQPAVRSDVQPVVQPAANPGWYPDPAGRFEHRWHDGHVWTAAVAHGGQQYHDPVPGT